MMEMHERLRIARKTKYRSAKAAADALGVSYPTYAGHENGADGFTKESAAKYAKRFRVSLEWLITGKGEMPTGKPSDQVAPQWEEEIQQAVRNALEAGATSGQIGAAVTDALLEHLPGKLQQLDEDGRTRLQTAEALAERNGAQEYSSRNGGSEDTRKSRPTSTSHSNSVRNSRNS